MCITYPTFLFYLFKEWWSHLIEASSPCKELVCCIRRDIRDSIESCLFHIFCSFLDSIRIFFTTTAHEYALNLFFVLYILWSINTAAQQSVITECFRT